MADGPDQKTGDGSGFDMFDVEGGFGGTMQDGWLDESPSFDHLAGESQPAEESQGLDDVSVALETAVTAIEDLKAQTLENTGQELEVTPTMMACAAQLGAKSALGHPTGEGTELSTEADALKQQIIPLLEDHFKAQTPAMGGPQESQPAPAAPETTGYTLQAIKPGGG